jgi:urease accessory protein
MHRLVFAALLGICLAQPAFAHTGIGAAEGIVHGLTHPLTGLDHMLAMVAVGLLAVVIGGRAIWLVPGPFLAMMIVAGALGMAGIAVPGVEWGIVLSVVVLGAVLALGIRLPLAAATALAAIFAVFHGYAHGAEMPGSVSAWTYGAGFVAATAALHAGGIGLGLIAAPGASWRSRLPQFAGAAIAIAGLMLLVDKL